MQSVLSELAASTSQWSWVTVPVAFFVTSCISTTKTPSRHSLLINAISWASIWAYGVVRAGVRTTSDDERRRNLIWVSGALYGLALACTRAAIDDEGVRWMKCLIPAFVYLFSQLNLKSFLNSSSHEESKQPESPHPYGARSLLTVSTICSGVVLNTPYITSPSALLGLCSTLTLALSFVVLESGFAASPEEKYGGAGGFVLANGSFAYERRTQGSNSKRGAFYLCIRDFAAIVVLVCGASTWIMESHTLDGLTWSDGLRKLDPKTIELNPELADLSGQWKLEQLVVNAFRGFWATIFTTATNALLMLVVSQQKSLKTSLIVLAAVLAAFLPSNLGISQLWFTLLTLTSGYAFFSSEAASSPVKGFGGRRLNARNILTFLTVTSVASLVMGVSRKSTGITMSGLAIPTSYIGTPISPLEPMELSDKKIHPIEYLIAKSEKSFQETLSRQSQTLDQAVKEYKRRYQMNPPPNFDRWYELAKRKNVVLIDEFDLIHELLLPFWALKPSTLRSRVREALGMDGNSLIALTIREGQAVKVEGGPDWQQAATLGMVKGFVQHLPDIDLAFNIHDEPRIVVPHDELARYVEIAKTKNIPASFSQKRPQNTFSARPDDMNDGRRILEYKTSRFNVFAHQSVWSTSRLSCSLDSPARSYEETSSDNKTMYALGELGFIYNHTAMSDICNSPSLRHTLGFFDRPNAFNVAHDLIPIFSQSKVSSFQDILYPSPWYWFNMVSYNATRAKDWDKKDNTVYWRGTNTGGYSKYGAWRHHHRQHFVASVNAPDTTRILTNLGTAVAPVWNAQEVPRQTFKDLIDVKFTDIGQCDDIDCAQQREFFRLTDPTDMQDAWSYKHLVDLDGNAFSGRFYAFLKSKSAVYKMAVFREWHQEWLRPWMHYVPLGFDGGEWMETFRYFANENKGEDFAEKLALGGQQWANAVLRNEDMEVWFFRLLLEYGRLVDDNREIIGYGGP
ncbi:glycosyltransferase family 90 protein [Patellaria atrata CBS 101060]|uniref:Glycosyltransferase family 90 protein n=1 Tax=Patellaria atrata CBS 101060 TaxID=1346257 RepID=A0A9P4VIW6_9PEZI|nr:glycosyltransferase family 90 protein [Patellaria atrata CBS 101060]